jgi:hypothetical protein
MPIQLFLQSVAEGTDETWIAVAAIISVFTLATVIGAMLVWQVGYTIRARSSIAREEAYKRLAQESSDAQQRATGSLDTLLRDLGEVKSRTAEIERMMKEV